MFLLLVPTLSFADEPGLTVTAHLEIQTKPITENSKYNCWYKNPFYEQEHGVFVDSKYFSKSMNEQCPKSLEFFVEIGSEKANMIFDYMNNINYVVKF